MTRGKKIRTLRESKGLRQEDLAKASGVSRVTIIRLENDEPDWDPTIVTLAKIAQALDIPVNDLVAKMGTPSSEIDAAIEKMINSGMAKLTFAESDWLRSLPQEFWTGWKVSPEAILELLRARAKVMK